MTHSQTHYRTHDDDDNHYKLQQQQTGYVRHFRGLKTWLEQQRHLKDFIIIDGLEDRGVTGNFEVRIGGSLDEPKNQISSGRLIHSKRTGGQGRAESSHERAMIAEYIMDYIDENNL